MRGGTLRHPTRIERRDEVIGGTGQRIARWSTFVPRWWASIEPLSGREYFEAQQVKAGVSHRVRGRYCAGIKPSMRVVKGDRVLNIDAVLNRDERNRELELLCSEAV